MSGSKCGLPGSARRLTEKSPARHPPPHQPSPAGSASATPPQGGQPQGLCRCAGGQGGGYWFGPPTASAFACGSASATPPQGGSDTRAPYASLQITPPWRGSRRDQGGARSRAGGGGTRRPVSDDQRHYRRQGGGNWLAPPPHQSSPSGSASATPPRGGSDTERGTNRGCRSHIRPGTWFTSCQGMQEALCQASSITPPWRGSRREGGARSRAGGGGRGAL